MCGSVRASIDASSIIYLLKTGVLGTAASAIHFYASPQVIDEVGWPSLPVRSVVPKGDFSSNDESVLILAEELGVPVISEDKKILLAARERGIPFYNAAMVLNYLLKIEKINITQYDEFFSELVKVARYSRDVIEYAVRDKEQILRELESRKGK